MIGRLQIDEPEWDPRIVELVDQQRDASGQGYASIQALGLAGAGTGAPQLRLYAGYQHIRHNPDDGPAWLELATLHSLLNELDAAEAILREVIRIGDLGLFSQVYQEDPEARLAHAFAASERFQEALDLLNTMEDRHSGLPIYHYVRGSIHHNCEDFESAMAEYREGIDCLLEARDQVDDEVDVDAIVNVMIAQRVRAETGEPFDGTRPFDMVALLEQQEQ